LTDILPIPIPSRDAAVHWLADTAERVARTFVQAFLAVFVPAIFVPGSTVHLDTLEKAAAAGAAAGLAAVIAFGMALVARWTGSSSDASFIKRDDAIPATATLVSSTPVGLGTVSAAAPVVVNVYQAAGATALPVALQDVPEPADAAVAPKPTRTARR
jgi:hypothetical protein